LRVSPLLVDIGGQLGDATAERGLVDDVVRLEHGNIHPPDELHGGERIDAGVD
jgi:hypothetical protein